MNTLHECDKIGAGHNLVMDRTITIFGPRLELKMVA